MTFSNKYAQSLGFRDAASLRSFQTKTGGFTGSRLADAATQSLANIRRENQAWSDRHTQKKVSEYLPSFSDAQARDYHHVFVETWDDAANKRHGEFSIDNLHEYMDEYDLWEPDDDDHEQSGE